MSNPMNPEPKLECPISVAINTCIITMVTVLVNMIPYRVFAIPYERFVTSAANIIKQYWTTSLAIVSILPCRIHSSKTQLTTDNGTFRFSPALPTTDCTPAKRRMINLDCPCFVVFRLYQFDLQIRVRYIIKKEMKKD